MTTADLLSAMGWDLRALGEAQLRDLTALQRCIEDFRVTGDRDALAGIRKHAGDIDQRQPQVRDALEHVLETVEMAEKEGR